MNNFFKKMALILLTSSISLLSCNSGESTRAISEEKKNNVELLKALQDKEYEHALQYFGKSVYENSTKDDVLNTLRHMEDTFGILKKYELRQTKSTFESKSGSKSLGTRRYTYLVYFTKVDSLLLTLVYDLEQNNSNNKDRKINFFTIDDFTEE